MENFLRSYPKTIFFARGAGVAFQGHASHLITPSFTIERGCTKKCVKGFISRLRRRNIIHLNKRSLNVLFQWTKGIKKMKHRRELEYPLEDVGDAPVELLKLLKSKRSNDFLFDKLTPAMVNKQLRATGIKEKTTTGSFRRLFAKRIRNHCAKKKISVSSMMLHISAEMVSGFYDIGNKN
jgi:hypothetical protein